MCPRRFVIVGVKCTCPSTLELGRPSADPVSSIIRPFKVFTYIVKYIYVPRNTYIGIIWQQVFSVEI